MFFILCLITSTGLIVQPHSTPEHTLEVVSWQGVVQYWDVHGTMPNRTTGFHVAWECDYITILSLYLPDKGHIVALVVSQTTCNIRLLSATP